ncbi:MAG: type 4a pilus biogenesis protein PilO [bacterium]
MNLREPYIQKGLAVIVVAIALIWLVFFTGFLPFSRVRTKGELEKLKQELQVAAGDLQRAKAAAQTLPAVEGQIKELEEKWRVLSGLLPKSTEMSSLLTAITTAGMRAGVEFTLFEPGASEPAGLYVHYPIKVSVVGNYHQVGRFLDNLCNMERLFGISNLVIIQNMGQNLGATVEASATISAYTYTDKSEAETAARESRVKSVSKSTKTGKK